MIGTYLKNLRKEQNIKVVELAKAVQVSQPYISNIENEKRYPSKDLFFKIIISIAELSPINYEIYNNLDLSNEQKKEIDILDILPEFWDKYRSSVLETINEWEDEELEEKEIISCEDFIDYFKPINLNDMSVFPEFIEFLDSKYGPNGYTEMVIHNDYDSYKDPEYVKGLVTDYWYQSILTDFIECFEAPSSMDEVSKAEYTEIMLGTLTGQELEIYFAVKELQKKGGLFDRYTFKELNKNNLTDLNIIDHPEAIFKLSLDGKLLSDEDIIALQTTINGIRYKR